MRLRGAMARAYESSDGDLAERLLVALEAAQHEGGDIRGRQSAAIVEVAAESTGKPWIDRRFDLRVEDHPEPIRRRWVSYPIRSPMARRPSGSV